MIWLCDHFMWRESASSRFRLKAVGRDQIALGRRKDGKGNFIMSFIMNVTGSEETDKPVLMATVNRLRKAGLKLQYELFK